MKNLLVIILATLFALTLAVSCSKDEPETSTAVSTPQATTSTPVAMSTTATLSSQTATASPAATSTTTSLPSPLPTYTWEEAIENHSRTATVIGPVIEVEQPDGPGTGGLIWIGKNGGFMGYGFFLQVVIEIDVDMYTGHTVAATGYIAPTGPVDNRGARIYVDDVTQIEIID